VAPDWLWSGVSLVIFFISSNSIKNYTKDSMVGKESALRHEGHYLNNIKLLYINKPIVRVIGSLHGFAGG
jgi:hypothetical protein